MYFILVHELTFTVTGSYNKVCDRDTLPALILIIMFYTFQPNYQLLVYIYG